MERNLDRRVEVLCPVLDRNLLEYLRETVLGAYLRDTRPRHGARTAMGTTGRPRRDDGDATASARRHFLLARHTTDYA